MSVIFLRHAMLKYPFNNYENLSLSQLEGLATEKIQPHINQYEARAVIKMHIDSGFLQKDSIDAIYHSYSVRSKETAQLLAETLRVKDVRSIPGLQELSFSPLKMVTVQEFRSMGMDSVRLAVYRAVERDQLDETSSDLLHRIIELRKLVQDNHDRNIIIVTHGFFLRLIQLALQEGKISFSEKDQKLAANHDYLRGFKYDK